MITRAVEDYLKAIYTIQESGARVSTTAIAAKLDVAQASVTGMIKKLAEMKLATHTPYYGVALTKEGEKIALEIIRHHRLLELYLAEAMGYTWDKVHDEAERLEHVISEEFEERIDELLGRPTHDPHGAPIPSKDGKVEAGNERPLSDMPAGAWVVIKRVSDRNPEKLRYLANLGMYPNIIVQVVERAPFDGPIRVHIGKEERHVGRELAREILVAPAARQEGSGMEPT
jgi:DtxR family Mn-dependent transcriptional regulator